MGKKKTKSKRNNELKIIFFIILIAAALFIISTYAWFSTQKDVSITNLQGTVEVAEGLEISLNAKTWLNEIVLGSEEGQFNLTDASTDFGPYPGHHNLVPSEMLPVSTLGLTKANINKKTDLEMIRGKITNSIILEKIGVTKEDVVDSENALFPGYFAFDVFLKNSSKPNDEGKMVEDILQLNYNSSLQITDPEKAQTGLQNTLRVAFAKYGAQQISFEKGNEAWSGVEAIETTDQTTILKNLGAIEGGNTLNITDCAIWEPNSNDHVEYIVTNNNKLTWAQGDPLYQKAFQADTQMPTHALKIESVGKTIADIYDWSGTNSATMEKQVTLQTTKYSETDYTPKEGVQNLISTTEPAGTTTFSIAPNSILRLRVYVWLEGQDVDCINYASYGGGVTINLGLVKGSTPGSRGEAPVVDKT